MLGHSGSSGGDGCQGKEEHGLQIRVMPPGRHRLWVVPGSMADEHVLILRGKESTRWSQC